MAPPTDDDDRISGRSGRHEDEEDQDAQQLGRVQALIQTLRSWIERNSKQAFNLSVILMSLGIILLLIWMFMLIAEMRRPTLEMAFAALEQGAYPQARDYAESVLRYAKKNDTKTKADAHFILGLTLSKEIETAPIPHSEELSYYRHAVDALVESRQVGFPLSYQSEGYFYLGKSLFIIKEYSLAIEAFQNALLCEFSEPRIIYWYLSNAYYFNFEPQYEKALQSVDRFLSIPPFTRNDNQRAYLLRSLINLRLDRLDEAIDDFKRVPEDTPFQAERELVWGRILIEQGNHAEKQVRLLQQDPQISVSETELQYYRDHKEQNGHEQEDTDSPPQDDDQPRRQDTSQSQPILLTADQDEVTLQPNLDYLELESQDEISKQELIRYWENFARRKFEEAIVRFTNVQTLDMDYSDNYRMAAFLIGYCFERLGEFDKAQEQYYTLFRTFPGTMEAIASQFRWSYLEYLYGDLDMSFVILGAAIEGLKKQPNYFNTWISVKEVINLGINAINDSITSQEYEKTQRLLYYFFHLMQPGEHAKLNAHLYEEWVKTLQNQAENASQERKKELTRKIEEKYREAARWNEEYAGWMFTSPVYSDILWSSAEYYRLGRQFNKAIPLYQEYLHRNVIQRQMLTHYHIGTMLFEMGDLEGALEELKFCIDSNSNDSILPDARVQTSRVYMELKEYSKAIELLQKNLDGLLDPASDLYKDSYFLMGKSLFLSGDYRRAIAVLDDTIQLYPDFDQLPKTLYYIARALQEEIWQIETEMANSTLDHLQADADKMIEQKRLRAVNYLKRAKDILSQRLNRSALSKSEMRLLRNCGLMIGSLLIDLGPEFYEEAEKYNRQLIVRFQGDPDVLQSYVQLMRVLTLQNRLEDAEKIKIQIKNRFREFQKSGAYQGGDNIYSEKDLLELFDAVQLFD